jgi:6-phosphogluconolactonase
MNDEWAKVASLEVLKSINNVFESKSQCNFMLTGGASALRLYVELKPLLNSLADKRINFYLTDERLVADNHQDSNFRLIFDCLLSPYMSSNWILHPIYIENIEPIEMARRYSNLIPRDIDVGIFGVGNDGHIASIFPQNNEISSENYYLSSSDSHKHQRITASRKIISNIRNRIVLAPGEDKLQIYKKAKKTRDPNKYPIVIALEATWIFGDGIIRANKDDQ